MKPRITPPLVSFLLALTLYAATCSDTEHPPTACDEVASHDSYYADPVTRLCGVYMGGKVHISSENCSGVLALPHFAELKRACWDKK